MTGFSFRPRSVRSLSVLFSAFMLGFAAARADISLPTFFGNGMVLQRDGAAPVWGTTSPGENITAELNGQSVSGTADSQGHWKVIFQNLSAGGPCTLTIKGGADSRTVSNVYVGDVWLCSGQSNMAFTVAQMGALASGDVAAANDPQLHWFDPVNYFAEVDPFAGRNWTDTTPATAPAQSGVAFYFAQKLRANLKIPIGIICNAFPGTPIEGWMSKDAFDSLGMTQEAASLTQQWQDADATAAKFLDDLRTWEARYGRQDPGNKGFAGGWADPKTGTSDWKTIPNLADWSSLSVPNGGVVWIRKSFELSPDLAGKDLDIVIGYLRNDGKEFGNVLGTVYVNNQQVGTLGDTLRRGYTAPDEPLVKVPGSLLVAGTNVIAVRFFTQEEKAPFTKTALLFRPANKKAPYPTLSPDCLAKVEAMLPALPPDAPASRPAAPRPCSRVRIPSYFYQSMLEPLVGYGIKGVIWYQGEGNTAGPPSAVLGNYPPLSYRKLLPAMIADWRRQWNQPDLPFYIVQLPNTDMHMYSGTEPWKSDWAMLRESQAVTAKTVPHTNLVVTIDTGTGELHPPNKKPVGERIALSVLANTYGEKIEACGPVYDSMTVEGDKIRIKFTHAGGGLVARNGVLKQFAIAGADMHFVWGDAAIDGDTVVVSSARVPSPVAVRYAWADDPTGCNLYNKEGLPAAPFRTDTAAR